MVRRPVAENIAGLVGEHIDRLRPIEAALLILAAYLHDIGMVFSEAERASLSGVHWPAKASGMPNSC